MTQNTYEHEYNTMQSMYYKTISFRSNVAQLKQNPLTFDKNFVNYAIWQ